MPPSYAASQHLKRGYLRSTAQLGVGKSLAQGDENGQPAEGPGGDEQDAAHVLLEAERGVGGGLTAGRVDSRREGMAP